MIDRHEELAREFVQRWLNVPGNDAFIKEYTKLLRQVRREGELAMIDWVRKQGDFQMADRMRRAINLEPETPEAKPAAD